MTSVMNWSVQAQDGQPLGITTLGRFARRLKSSTQFRTNKVQKGNSTPPGEFDQSPVLVHAEGGRELISVRRIHGLLQIRILLISTDGLQCDLASLDQANQVLSPGIDVAHR